MITIFRGKAATGKSTLSRVYSHTTDIEVMSKDTVFDVLLVEGYTWKEANKISYDKLKVLIKQYHDDEVDLIVDIGLANTERYIAFIRDLNLNGNNIRKYHCTCSDDRVWSSRIQERIDNPTAPNQSFKSIEAAFNHYRKSNIYTLDDEIELDSIYKIEHLMTKF